MLLMEGHIGDSLNELLENELVVDDDDEDSNSALAIEEQDLRHVLKHRKGETWPLLSLCKLE